MSEIFELEKALLSIDVRKNPQALNLLIADDFIEFGRSGVWNKGDILNSLPFENENNGEISNFRAIFQTSSTACVEYQLNENGEIALRRSIWKFTDERWQMVFHECV